MPMETLGERAQFDDGLPNRWLPFPPLLGTAAVRTPLSVWRCSSWNVHPLFTETTVLFPIGF